MLNCAVCAKLTGAFRIVEWMDAPIAPFPKACALNMAEAGLVSFRIVIDPCNDAGFVIVITLTPE